MPPWGKLLNQKHLCFAVQLTLCRVLIFFFFFWTIKEINDGKTDQGVFLKVGMDHLHQNQVRCLLQIFLSYGFQKLFGSCDA